MPLTKRLVEPVCVGREKIPAGVKNELEFVTNNTLANVILQLSNLSRHAEDLFGEIHAESASLIRRSTLLQNRIDRLAVKTTQLDSAVEEVTLEGISRKKQFRSSNLQDDRVVSRDTLPTAMRDVYEACDMPPPLNKLNPYRTDGKEGLAFYTDPDYFFELWKKNMLEGGDKQRAERARKPGRSRATSENRAAKTIRPPQNNHLEQMRAKTLGQEAMYPGSPQGPANIPQNTKSSYPYMADQYAMAHGVPPAASYDMNKYGTIRSQSRPGKLDLPPPYDTISPDGNLEETVHMVDYRAPGNFVSAVHSPQPTIGEAVVRTNRGTPTRPNQPPPAPPSTGSGTLSTRSTPTSGREVFPPPPPDMQTGRHSPTPPPSHDFPPPPGALDHAHQHTPPRVGPAPPPPPPPPVGLLAGPAKTVDMSARQKSAEPVPAASQVSASKIPAPVKVSNTMVDARSHLLEAIRGGINLRKVELQNEQQSRKAGAATSSGLHNVAEIIARRKAMQHSDSDTSSETEADSEWDDLH